MLRQERENLLSFCRAVQRNSPVGSYIVPEAGATVCPRGLELSDTNVYEP